MPYKGYTEMWDDDFFHPHTQVALVEEKLDPIYFMNTLIPELQTTSPVAVEIVDGPSGEPGRKIDDVLKRRAPARTLSSEFHPIRVSGISKKYYGMDQIGFKLEFEEEIQDMEYIDLVSRTHQRAAEWMAAQRNLEILEKLTNDFSLTESASPELAIPSCDGLGYAINSGYATGIIYGELDTDYQWTAIATKTDQLYDLSKLRSKMKKQPGNYSVNMDTVIMDTELYHDIILDLERLDYKWIPEPWGGRESMRIPKFHDVRIIEALWYDGLPEDMVLCLDSSQKPGVTYKYDKPTKGFSKWKQDSNFWVHQYMDDDTHDLITQMWERRRTVNQNKHAVAVLKVK